MMPDKFNNLFSTVYFFQRSFHNQIQKTKVIDSRLIN